MRLAVARSLVVAVLTTGAFANAKAGHASEPLDEASIYISPRLSSTKHSQVLSETEGLTVLAHQLGLSQFYPLDDITRQSISFKTPTQELFTDKNSGGSHYIFITGAESDFLASEDLAPPFKAPAQSSLKPESRFLNPQNTLLKQAAQLSGHATRTTLDVPDFVDPATNTVSRIESKDCITVDIVPGPNAPPTRSPPNLPHPSWEHFLAVSGSNGVAFDRSIIGHYVFGLSISSLVNFLALPETEEAFMDGNVYITIPSLNWLNDAATYDAATSFLKNTILSSVLHADGSIQSSIIIISPSKDAPSPTRYRSSELKKRYAEEIPISAMPPPSSHVPRPEASSQQIPEALTAPKTPLHARLPRYFDSQKKCETQTNQCSTHGSCIKSDYPTQNKWVCKCKPSANTYWGGNACQKVDISVQFHLILIITLVVLGAIGATIGAMLSMGSEELPGVLTAGLGAKKS
ncbi:hypothetical protein DFH27DRAFT_575533 [Peziza echinospora]|nr:hypothetical protein DFH27DRAFT_575533 [Peziza echinospora]